MQIVGAAAAFVVVVLNREISYFFPKYFPFVWRLPAPPMKSQQNASIRLHVRSGECDTQCDYLIGMNRTNRINQYDVLEQ